MNGHAELAEAMKRQGAAPFNAFSFPRHAKVSSYNPKTYAVKVMLQPENVESNWMPLGTEAVGSSWGIAVGPQIGDMVVVVFPEGDFNSGVVMARLYSTQQLPPVVNSGEMVIQHSSGSFLKFNADGSITLNGAGNLNITAPAVNITGPVNVTGPITATGTIQAPTVVGTTNVTFGGKSGIAHTHGGVQTGAGNTGAPN